MGILNLPPIPSELKPVTPYLQRAEEVKSTDPVIAYWCAYHAAQLGISLKLKDTNARSFLFDLLGTLERMKSEIGPNDAIDDESASSAYVENFALRVFAMADNEDRKGNATRGTAKKFLAAANFLEVLSIVATSTPATIDIPEKIRYAKWKAADIAKAFREGRKPTPGGIGEQLEQKEEQLSASPKIESASPSAIQRSVPPPGPIVDMPHSSPEPHGLPSGFADPRVGPLSPGEWSTVATPGATTRNEDFHSQPKSILRNAWVSEELEGTDSGVIPDGAGVHEGVGPADIPVRPHISPASSDSSSKKVHFTPSAIGGLTPSTTVAEEGPFASASAPLPTHDEPTEIEVAPSAPPLETESTFPQGFLPTSVIPQPLSSTTFPPPPLPILSYPTPSQSQIPVSPATIPPHGITDSTVTQTPQDLTPQAVARVQKHCRFAISALDYEDVEQARKELRAALDMLGG